MDNKRILEALQMQPLSDEEKSARHILGRLYGPIATCKESTRNGRLYNKQLWENALKDEIFLEKVATKSLFLELGHPTDREETDMTKACACIPECPKIVDDDLYAYVDILDTPNGKLLKTFVDYGFVPGISSRGSGDIIGNNEVDPETFFLETWDIVQLPAVKKARMNVCESVDTNALRLKKALTESYESASEEDRETMKEALDNLNIKLDEAAFFKNGTPTDEAEIPWSEAIDEEVETEATDDVLVEEAEEENVDEIEPEETEETEEVSEEETEDETKIEITAGEVVDSLSEVEPETPVDVEVEVEGEKVEVADIAVEQTDDAIEVGVSCEPVEGETDDNKEDEPEAEEVNSDEESVEDEAAEESEEAEDNGDDEVIESLKEMIRQKEALDKEAKALRNERAVGEAKVKELQEELDRYKAAFARVSELAAGKEKVVKECEALKESLTQKDIQIQELNVKAQKAEKLTESIDTNAEKVRSLSEKLATMQREAEEMESDLRGQLTESNKKVADRTKIAKAYKAKYLEVVNSYVASKASMLGVRPADITCHLGESYSLADIDKVCDDMLDSAVSFSRLPFGGMNSTKATIKESVQKSVKTKTNPEYGYEIDDSLYELAGLKK